MIARKISATLVESVAESKYSLRVMTEESRLSVVEAVTGETIGDELFVGSNCRFYLSSFAEQTMTDEYHQLMDDMIPAVKPATVVQEQVLASRSLRFDAN